MAGPRDGIEVEALVTDHYLESLLAARDDGSVEAAAFGWAAGDLDRGVRAASLRLRRDLPRFHPSFRFEERLALRLAEAAASLHLARAAGAESQPIPLGHPALEPTELAALAALADQEPDDMGLRRHARPLLLGGAVASAALSLAGAALVAWRKSHGGGAVMVRAVRAVRAAHAARAAAQASAGTERLD